MVGGDCLLLYLNIDGDRSEVKMAFSDLTRLQAHFIAVNRWWLSVTLPELRCGQNRSEDALTRSNSAHLSSVSRLRLSVSIPKHSCGQQGRCLYLIFFYHFSSVSRLWLSVSYLNIDADRSEVKMSFS